MKTLTLVKGAHRHVIRYEPGNEAATLDFLIEMVNDPAIDLDWFDAALLSHLLGQEIAKSLAAGKSGEVRT